MRQPARHLRRALPALGLALALPAHADTDTNADPAPTPAIYAQHGFARHSAHSQTVGVLLPWRGFQSHWLGLRWQGHWDLYAARWRAHDSLAGGRRNTLALGVSPTLRMTGQGARWFMDWGLGLVLNDRYHSNRDSRLSTRYNFASSVAVGLWLDAGRRHALSLQVQHISNAGLKRPNPGADFVQLRYARQF